MLKKDDSEKMTAPLLLKDCNLRGFLLTFDSLIQCIGD